MRKEQETILQLASTIADLQAQADEAKVNLDLWLDECRAREQAEKRIAELEAGFKDATERLLAKYNRALEALKGAGVEFNELDDFDDLEHQKETDCDEAADNDTALHHPFIANRFLTVK